MQLLSLFLVSSLRRTFQTIPPLLISVPPGIRLELGRRRISINGLATRLRSCLPLCLFFVFSDGRAEISEVSKCVGDAFLVTVRNKKRVGYTYELTLRVKGEWLIREEKKTVKGHIDVVEFSFGELDDLQLDGLEV